MFFAEILSIIIGGRTPFTWYPEEYVDNVPMSDMNMRANTSSNFPGRTYRFYNGKSIYAFGHGLSYSTFSKFIVSAPTTILIQPSATSKQHNILSQDSIHPKDLYSGEAIDISTINCQNLTFDLVVAVRNTGPRDGSHVVLVFLKPASSKDLSGAPNVQLIGFERVEVKKGKTENVTVNLDVCKGLNLVDSEGNRKLVTGQHTLVIGSPSERQVRHRLNLRLANNTTETAYLSF